MSSFLDAFREEGNYVEDSDIAAELNASSSDEEYLDYVDSHTAKKIKLENNETVEESLNLKALKSNQHEGEILSYHDLSKEQSVVYDLIVKGGRNVFFTGPAGSGKTTLLKTIIHGLKVKHDAFEDSKALRVGVTASTGLAAMNLKGLTFHSFLQIGLGTLKAEAIAKNLLSDINFNLVWNSLRVLIIDECSLINSKLFQKLEKVARLVRKNHKPFGGIQLVLVGDFYQLPPIIEDYDILAKIGIVKDKTDYHEFKRKRFAFCSPAWKKCIEFELGLKEVHRQKGDPKFIEYLNQIRLGNVTKEIDQEMQKLTRELSPIEGVEPTYLFPTKFKANNYNLQQMNKIKSRTYRYKAALDGKLKGTNEFAKMVEACMFFKTLDLKVGSQVMLVKNNFPEGVINGTKGVVVGFERVDSRLAEKTSNTKKNTNTENDTITHHLVNPLYGGNLESNIDGEQYYPIVKFLPDPSNPSETKTIIVQEEKFELQDVKTGHALFSMCQIPLIHSWAISIHKSQGQTYNFMKTDLRDTFEFGQCYVALSRVTSRAGLQLLNWHKSFVKANNLVNTFYIGLQDPISISKEETSSESDYDY